MNLKKNPTRVSNVPLRDPFLKSPKGPSQIARELGKVDATGKMDTTGLQRSLGLRGSPPTFKKGKRYPKGREYGPSFTTTISIETAKALCRILGVDFDELYADGFPEQQPAAHCKTCGDPMLRRVPSGQCGWCEEELALFGQVQIPVAA